MPPKSQKSERLLFRWIDVFVFSAASIFLLVIANIAWVLPILDEVELSAYSLLRARGAITTNSINVFLEHDLDDLRNGALLLNRNLDIPENVIARLLRENKSYDALILLDNEGNEVFVKQSRFVIESGLLSDKLFESVKNKEVFISELLFNKVGQPTVEYAIPLQEATGFSAIVAQVNLKFFIDEIFADLRIDKGSAIYIVDGSGYLIGHSTWQLVASRTNVLDRELVARALLGEEADTRNKNLIYINEKGNEVFATALPLELTNWALVVEQEQDPALTAAQRTINVAIVSFGFQVLLIMLILFIYFRLTKTAQLFYSERNQREAIMNNLVDGIIEYDDFSRVVLMNPRAESLLGVKLEEISGLEITPSILKEKPNLTALVEVMYPMLAPYASPAKKLFGGRVKVMDISTSNPKRSFEMTMLHILGQRGSVIGFLKILHDVSRERFIEKMKTEFISIAAHQLRTPLSEIKWSLGRILGGDEGEVPKSQKYLIERSYNSGERMISLVKDLLDVARIEEGRYLHKPTMTDVGKILKSSFESLKEVAKKNNITMTFHKEGVLPDIHIDPESMSVAFQNVIENAVRYTHSGGKVVVSLRHINTNIEIVIKDTGIGIPKRDYPRLFTKFFRAKNAILLETEGSGLGLFITKNIIEAHGGKIWFESEEGKGSAFHISLPVINMAK